MFKSIFGKTKKFNHYQNGRRFGQVNSIYTRPEFNRMQKPRTIQWKVRNSSRAPLNLKYYRTIHKSITKKNQNQFQYQNIVKPKSRSRSVRKSRRYGSYQSRTKI